MNFFYIDPTDYTDLYEACYAEVVAEAKDTGDYPMYGEAMLRPVSYTHLTLPTTMWV